MWRGTHPLFDVDQELAQEVGHRLFLGGAEHADEPSLLCYLFLHGGGELPLRCLGEG
jgi:hypothetical protein